MTGLKVKKPGVLATIQDWGRYGQRENGLSTGGPIDEHAFLWTNRLLDNPPGACTIELTVGLSIFESTLNTTVAVCGADMGLTINNKPVPNWSTHRIHAGDILSFRSARQGLRAYLGIRGGFQVAPVFASSATVVREHLGGLYGDALRQNDLVPVANAGGLAFERSVPGPFIPEYSNHVSLRFIPSYQFERFDQSQRTAWLNNSYIVSQRMDRMGCTLKGQPIHYSGPGIVSEGIAIGSIQLPPDGQPIILLKDSGSIGGYPKLGCVCRLDLNKLAQCKPGDQIDFRPVEMQTPTQELVEFYRFFQVNL